MFSTPKQFIQHKIHAHYDHQLKKFFKSPAALDKATTAVIAHLIAKGANVNLKMADGESILVKALQYGSRYQHIVECLLENGANAGVKAIDGKTPLSMAIDYAINEGVTHAGNSLIIKKLLAAHACPNIKIPRGEKDRETVLITLLKRVAWGDQADIVQQLLVHGADPNAEDSEGTPAVLIALNQGFKRGFFTPGDERIVMLLLQYGAKPQASNEQDQVKINWILSRYEQLSVIVHNVKSMSKHRLFQPQIEMIEPQVVSQKDQGTSFSPTLTRSESEQS